MIGIILIPLIILISLLIRIKMGSPVLFIQERPGLNGKIFKIYKFRSMANSNSTKSNPLHNYQRITMFGSILRKFSLDELPEFYNVLIGDMSIVGPRPLLKEYLTLYNQKQARRHEVRPGITGWAQVNGRNAISWQQKFDYDVWYAENLSFSLDLKIFLMTLVKVFRTEGVNQKKETTMEPFRGNPE